MAQQTLPGPSALTAWQRRQRLRCTCHRPSAFRQPVTGTWATLDPLHSSRALARSRGRAELAHPDPFAEALGGSWEQSGADDGLDGLVTNHLDEEALRAVNVVVGDKEIRQVVLLGCGMCTRPFRLHWPVGTVFFEVAPAEVHAAASRVLKERKAYVQRGCLLRRVPHSMQDEGLADRLASAGYRADRLSAWILQGVTGLQQRTAERLFAELSLAAAFDSLVFGELPRMPRRAAEGLLGGAGMLGRVFDAAGLPSPGGSGPLSSSKAGSSDMGPGILGHRQHDLERNDSEGERRWVFSAQHRQLSVRQMGIWSEHTQAAEELDEDFFDNFS